MTWEATADIVAAVLLVAGCSLSLLAAVGMLRLPDLLSRMHALTKPQVLGLLLVVLGLALRLRDVRALGLLALVVLFQFMTAPVASHVVSRAAFRAGVVPRDALLVDEMPHPLDPEPEPEPADVAEQRPDPGVGEGRRPVDGA